MFKNNTLLCIQCIQTLFLSYQNHLSDNFLGFSPKGGTLVIKGSQSIPENVHMDLVHPREETNKFSFKSLYQMLSKNSVCNTLALLWFIEPLPSPWCLRICYKKMVRGTLTILPDYFLKHAQKITKTCFIVCLIMCLRHV